MALYLVKHFLKKDFKIIVPKKKGTIYFFGIIFGETLLKKDFKIIVPKKGTIFFWHSHQKESQSSTSWYKVKNILHIHIVLHRTWHHLVDFHGGAWRCLRQLMAQNSFHICSHVCYFVFGPPAARSQNKLAT